MDFTRHAAEIPAQTELLVADAEGTDLRAPVPSCPGWTLGMLVRHVGAGHRWAEEIVRTRATAFPDQTALRVLDGDDTGELPARWLVEGASRLADTLVAAGPDAATCGPFHYRSSAFWARRFANETLVHRADATLAAGVPFDAAEDVLVESLDEWMDLDVLPEHFEIRPAKRDLLGAGRTLAFEATDVDARWFVDLTGEVITHHRGAGASAVTARAPLADLLLLVYRRKSLPDNTIAVDGDAALLDFWLGHVAFG